MSKIAEIKAFDRYPKDRKGCLYDIARNEYIKGYDQAMQDFMEKAEKFLYLQLNNGSIECGNIEKLIEQFKNYMQDESEN